MEAWRFLAADGITRYAPRMRTSVRAIDALFYAPGPIVCRVRMSGEIECDHDKVVVTWMYDATRVLYEFACCVAEAALLMADVKDPRCWQAIETRRAWLRGEVGNADMVAAREAARDAAWDAASNSATIADAAREAARDAARDAAWAASNAAWVAAWAAAWAAARAAAWAAARDATWAAAWGEQNQVLETMLYEGRSDESSCQREISCID
jgi:hypothetical protein